MGEIPKLPPDPLVGKKLGHAEIQRKLATGGMATVYYGIYDHSKTEVAVKVLASELIGDGTSIERFHREAEAAQQIHHANVVRVLEAGQEGPFYFIVMEFVRGEPLDAVMRRETKLDFDRATRITRDIARALEAAHTLGVIHRDVKPGNVIIDPEGVVKLTDFGVARDLRKRGLTAPGLMVGTAEFMAPEQVEGEELDARADIYALGVTYYHLLTGRYPFEGDSDVSVAMARLKQSPRPITEADPTVDLRCVPVIEKMLKRDPKERYETAREVIGALEKAMYGHGETKSRPAPAPAPAKRPSGTMASVPRKAPPAPPPKPVWGSALLAAGAVLWLAAGMLINGLAPQDPHGTALGLVGAALLTTVAGCGVTFLKLKGGRAWAGVGIAAAAAIAMAVGSWTAERGVGIWMFLVRPPALTLVAVTALAGSAIASFSRQEAGALVAVRRLAVGCSMVFLYMGAAGVDRLHAPMKLFGCSLEIAAPLAVLALFGAFFGAYLMTGYEAGTGGRIAGLAMLIVGAIATVLLGSVGAPGKAVLWPHLAELPLGWVAQLGRRFIADGALIGLGLGLTGIAIVVITRPRPATR